MRVVLLLGLLVACGDNAAEPDALMVDAIDAPPDSPSPPAGCDYGELFDSANDPTPEASGVSFATTAVFCGRVDLGHSVPSTMLLDADAFGFALSSATSIRAELAGTGLDNY